jgi:hypothetical protein
MPSQKDPVYRLCRLVRREARLGLTDSVALHTHPDTIEMIRHYCIPVATLYRFDTKIVAELKSRDLWDPANQDYVDKLEARETVAEEKLDTERGNDLLDTAADAYRGLKVIKGERVSLRDINRGRQGRTDTPNRVGVLPAVKRLTGPITKR